MRKMMPSFCHFTPAIVFACVPPLNDLMKLHLLTENAKQLVSP